MEKRDRTKKLGLVWERDEIEADNAPWQRRKTRSLKANTSDNSFDKHRSGGMEGSAAQLNDGFSLLALRSEPTKGNQ